MAPYESARVPAWKKLGLKLKPAAESPSAVAQPIIQDQTQTPSPLKRKPREEAPPAQKRAKTEAPTPRKIVSEAPAKRSPASIQPALDYLRQWRTARSSWKFNKNHQTTLIKYVFDPSLVPAADVGAFYAYIRDLQGFTRTRLREAALEARDNPGLAVEKRAAYEDLVKRLSGDDESEVQASASDEDVVRCVVARMRAQAVLEALEGESTDEGDKRVKLNDGTGKRRRKLRVNDESESSSEESSDSDTSSSGSDEDDDEDDEDEESGSEDGDESSSSSSSSSSEDEEDEEDEDEDDSSDGTAA